mmetsp:Transcript_4678/g.9988  ORF Transcript_4678/g.9988 Transcript_4678/m.9988 type:complete len:95 (-) Transcript_4678:1025-1309(-)
MPEANEGPGSHPRDKKVRGNNKTILCLYRRGDYIILTVRETKTNDNNDDDVGVAFCVRALRNGGTGVVPIVPSVATHPFVHRGSLRFASLRFTL